MTDLFIFAGETSGDLHGEKLLGALQLRRPDLHVVGVGGPKMRSLNMKCILPMEEFQVMGFIDVLLALPKLMRLFRTVRNAILSANPKVVLFIDYPGFNLRMAKALRKKKFQGKISHYICPSVWAWGKKRIPRMAQTLDLLMTILPFERDCFSETSLDVRYVGHPLVKRIQEHHYQDLNLTNDKTIIALFPGSRMKELIRNLPLQLRTLNRLLKTDPDLLFAISVSESRFLPKIEEMIQNEKLQLGQNVVLIPSENNYDLMRTCDLAIAKSGTVALELALHRVPTVVMYAVTPLDQFIALNIFCIRLRFYCLVNIICRTEVFPELIGSNLTEDSLYNAIYKFLNDPVYQNQCSSRCQELIGILQNRDAGREAAEALLNLLGY